MTIFIRYIKEIILSKLEEDEKEIERLLYEMDFQNFERLLQDKLHDVGRTIIKAVLEKMDQLIKQDKTLRPGWVVCRKDDEKEVVTCFGPVSYSRTYYRHKETGQYAYLVDEQAGYAPHMRLDPTVKAKLIEYAAEMSYRKSAEKVGAACGGVTLSGQTVLRAVREFKEPELPVQERKVVPRLYIEADEDHLACQHGRALESRLVYIHEGWEEKNGRRSLKNPVFLSGMDKEADGFWERIWDEVNKRYDLDRIEKIYVIGDGAAWIKCARLVFPKAEFILDKFHLMKYIRQALGGNKELNKTLMGALRFGNFEKAQEVIEKLLKRAPTASRKQAIIQAWGYIRSNWEGITRIYSYKEIKCSAEGHISHVLSARMSSRPMGWSQEGAKHMAYIRVCQANGQSVAEEYLRQQQANYKIAAMITSPADTLEDLRAKNTKTTSETHDNIPVLKGPKTFLYKALRELSLAYA